ncbi:hypothetical protein SAMN04487845_1716 [Methylobacterium sp. yr668]|nr:hypothetical protein SAMN04487845_1716 [Methylobacterium sp. yr668]
MKSQCLFTLGLSGEHNFESCDHAVTHFLLDSLSKIHPCFPCAERALTRGGRRLLSCAPLTLGSQV